MRILLTISAIFLAMSTANVAQAQFLGDVFFERPSISAATGDEVNLTVAAFSGSEVFGSAEFALTFDSTLLDIKAVDFPDGISGTRTERSDSGLTELRLVVANGVSLQRPSGVVLIANITGRVLANPGTMIGIATENKNVFLANRTEITNGSLGAEVVVQTQGPSMTKRSSGNRSFDAFRKSVVEAWPGTDLYERARKLRPSGSLVRLAATDGSYLDIVMVVDED